MKQTRICFVNIAGAVLFLFLISPASGQIDVGNYTLSGEAEVGGLPRSFTGEKARFEEYRDIPESVIVPQLQLLIGGKKEDFYLNFNSLETGRNDQSYTLRAGRYGLLDLEFQWDQIPHLFSEDVARTPYSVSHGHTTFFTLSSKPSAATATTSCATSPICQWVNGNSHEINLNLFNGIGRFNLRYTPTPGWTFTGSYWSNHNVGDRAFGTLFASSPGSFNITELAEPINYQTHNIELGGEYAGKGWSLGLKYTASLFNNLNSTIVWDNPLNLSNSVGGVLVGPCVDSAVYNNAIGTGPCRGRLDLYPSNQAHTFTLSGAAALPFSSHFMGTASYGWRLQDDRFLPFTINSAICPDQSACFPSRRSLGGDVRPLMVNATLVNNFFNGVNLKLYERFYDLGNHNNKVVEPKGFIVNDQGAFNSPGDPLTPDRFAYSKNNIGAEAAYNFTRWLSGKLSYGWERMHRQAREVRNSDEHGLGPTFDIKPSSDLLFRAAYKHFWRNAPNYQAAPDVDASNLSRKFDEAARQRDKVSFFGQYTPWDRFTTYAGFEFTSDRYHAVLGTQNDINYSPSIGFIYSPLDWLKLFANYNWDRYGWLLHAEDRTDTSTQTPFNSCVPFVAQAASRCWTSRGKDEVNTINIGSDMDLIPNVLGFRISYTFSAGRSEVHSSGDPQSTTPATNYPPVENTWHELLARFEYKFHKNMAFRIGYYFNHANEQDFGVDIMKPWMGDVDVVPTPNTNTARSIFLGDRIKGPFTAHVGFITLKLNF
jgi:MtrB/PioB family decaheme-associated outer membrane protein